MRKKILALGLIFLLFGCAEAVRYTDYEIKDFPTNIQEAIKKGEVLMGMTTSQVRYAWGPPSKSMSSYVEGKHREHWIYKAKAGMEKTHLFFEDGKLTFWSTE